MEATRIIDPQATYEQVSQALPADTELLNEKFKIKHQIGHGGFGITYLARDVYLDRDVVIKECFPESLCCRFGTEVRVTSQRHEAQHRQSVEMFMREARSIAKLRHPNIVGVHQVFEENQTAYMVLDLIHGRDLLDIIEDSEDPLHPDQIHAVLVKTLDAMDLVHSNDLLHRDISPDNILLDKWGSPSLIDFGAAREEASKKSEVVSTMLVVKDGYSPHEFYLTGSVQGPCSDLYALGATMYHLITGEAPPDSQSRVASLASDDSDPYEPLVGRFPQFEKAFLKAIDTALRLSPKERIQSAKEWLEQIQTDAKKVKVVNIPVNKKLSKTLSELITETNAHVAQAPMKLKPDAVVEDKPAEPKRYRPEWIEEFNRETSEKEEERKKAHARRAAKQAAQLAEIDLLIAEITATKSATINKQSGRNKSRNLLDWIPLGRTE